MNEKPPLESLHDERYAESSGGRWYGVYPALVSDVKDPDAQGRVKVTLPWSPDGGGARYEAWARLCTLSAGPNRGSWFVPDVNDEVLVSFEGGDPRRPFVLGALWNGRDLPPEVMDGGGQNNKKVLRTRGGVKVTLDDTTGNEKLILETRGGQKVTLEDGHGSLELRDSHGNSIMLDAMGITIKAATRFKVNTSTAVISAGEVTVGAAKATFHGEVKCDTVIANSVVGSSYTPGAGNLV